MPTDWEARYQTNDMPWEKGEASPGLVDFLAAHPALKRGTVCVPGCGTGHDVRAWARAGFTAVGYDLAPSAIRLSIERTKAAGLSAQFQLVDFLRDSPRGIGDASSSLRAVAGIPRGKPPQLFDWLFEHTLFCAIDPSERDEYVRAVLRWLKPDGQYLAVNYLIPDKDGPPFGTTREELWQRFSPHFDLMQEWVPRSYPNRTGLELMLWWRRKKSA
ncbi:MAG: methyltransferase domain-containing protein [Verrucomicrobia bacterium]|nr:methyltransferase domain-containing protein [Verrucomicrobiota bacterium]